MAVMAHVLLASVVKDIRLKIFLTFLQMCFVMLRILDLGYHHFLSHQNLTLI